MASGKTLRRSIPYPLKTDPDTITADVGNLAKVLDNDAETGSVKNHTELPAAKTRGRIWQVTEGEEKGLWWDTGAAWITAGQYIENLSIIAAKLAKEAVTTEKIAKEAVGDTQIGPERALVRTANVYTAFNFNTKEGVVFSSERMVFVSVIEVPNENEVLECGGVVLTEKLADSFTFLCPPGQLVNVHGKSPIIQVVKTRVLIL